MWKRKIEVGWNFRAACEGRLKKQAQKQRARDEVASHDSAAQNARRAGVEPRAALAN